MTVSTFAQLQTSIDNRSFQRVSYIQRHPKLMLIAGCVLLLAACFSAFYMTLAVGVSDGAGHVTAIVMLASSGLFGAGALLLIVASVRAILTSL